MKRREMVLPAKRGLSSCASAAVVVMASMMFNQSAGAQMRHVWRTQVDGGQHLAEYDFDVSIDHRGYADTVGWYLTPASGFDALIHQYDRTGKLLWTAAYDGSGHGDDYFGNVVVDSQNNVITGGTSPGANGDNDLAVVKYDKNGHLLWSRRYDGPSHSDDGAYAAENVGVDATDSIYIAGYQYAADNVYEYVVVKYAPDGTQQWVSTWRGPNGDSLGYSMTVAPNGDIFVGGDVYDLNGYSDFAVVKFDANGNQVWAQSFDSEYHGNDSTYCVAIDSSENVFVAGISDSLYLNGDFEYCVVKYDPSGNYQWEGRYGGNYGFHYGWIVRADQQGGAFVTGGSMNTGGDYDAATVHWNSAGTQTWAQRYYHQGYFGEDWGDDLAVDADGNAIVAGYGWQGYEHSEDAYLLRYSPTGQLLDAVVDDGPANGDDSWSAVAIDDAGRIVCAGGSLGLGTNGDSCIGKFVDLPTPELIVNPDPLHAAQSATFTATNFEPNSACYLGYSTQGAGNLFVSFLNVTLGLNHPQQAGGVVMSDANGTAVWTLHIPGNASGANVWFQTAQYNQVSNVLATHVQ